MNVKRLSKRKPMTFIILNRMFILLIAISLTGVGSLAAGVFQAKAGPPEGGTTLYLPLQSKGEAQAEQMGTIAGPYPTYDLLVDQTGFYRVTYERLRDAGLDLKNVKASDIGLTNRGVAVPIRMKSSTKFGPGSYFEFYAQALDTLYTKVNVYSVKVDKSMAARIPLASGAPIKNVDPAVYYMETATLNNNLAYDMFAPHSDPWYEAQLLVYKTPKSWTYTINTDNYLANVAAASLNVIYWGGSDMAQSPDHHVIIKLNGVSASDKKFNGVSKISVSANLPDNTVIDGSNVMEVNMPGDTAADWDIVRLERYSLTYPRAYVARNGRLTFSAASTNFKVMGLPTQNILVYKLDGTSLVKLENTAIVSEGGAYSVKFAGASEQKTYLVSTAEAMLVPTRILPARAAVDIKGGNAQLLIISHPLFKDNLAPLVQARQAQGYTVKVVDVDDIYAQYNYGIFDPRPIKDYISYAANNMGTQYVLLVGGDSYDYFNNMGYGNTSFIPTFYANIDSTPMKYGPVDPLFVDIDSDNYPELPLGRFPVKTTAELDALIDKTLDYGNKTYVGTAIFSADYDFSNDSESFVSKLPPGWLVDKAYLDQDGLTVARNKLIEKMNKGVALANYVGHADQIAWSYEGLFYADDAEILTNTDQPMVVAQYGCMASYFVDPTYDALGHAFMDFGDRGAAAVLGATTINYADSQRDFGDFLTPRLTTPGKTIGQAMQEAKEEMIAWWGPLHPEVNLGWTILGDPTLVVAP